MVVLPVCVTLVGADDRLCCRPELNVLALQPWANLELPEKVNAALDEVRLLLAAVLWYSVGYSGTRCSTAVMTLFNQKCDVLLTFFLLIGCLFEISSRK